MIKRASVSPVTGNCVGAAGVRDRGAGEHGDRRRPPARSTNATAPTTTAFAARARPRRGLAASVTRIRFRRYSAVMNMVATTASAISPANVPRR